MQKNWETRKFLSLTVACLHPMLDQSTESRKRIPEAVDVTSASNETLQFDDNTLGGEGMCALSFPCY